MNKIKSYCFLGDDRAKQSIYNQEVPKYGLAGLPINDAVIKRMFLHFEKVNVIFFSCGYPLMGCQEIENVKSLQNKTVGQRFIPYHLKPGSRGFYNK
ncbi:MAG: hypothetical protein F6K40_17520 [Okeania sp. SIO3I5]|uniref:hypothetical protein n=1 Tax=Okeania sp. SIO3I5 TaxID=2607805 RepID=UPI0013B7B814|nr:hypothetical protein [Okeania sp. SIO3I5]NEQ37965.1 hypothetical protein [Okeania sp. SIO3I5]